MKRVMTNYDYGYEGRSWRGDRPLFAFERYPLVTSKGPVALVAAHRCAYLRAISGSFE